MEDTVCKNCPWVKSGFCDKIEECPNYVQSWWEQQEGAPKLVTDCVPKRLMLQMAHLHLRVEGAQLAAEQARNQSCAMKEHFIQLVDASKAAIEEQKQLETMSRELALEAREKLLLEKKD